MKFIFQILVLCIISLELSAHSTKEAFFNISNQDDFIKIEAEFPWTIRKALFEYAPYLEDLKDQQKIESAFFDYVRKNMFLKTELGELIKLIDIKEVRQEDPDSHHANFIFRFENKELFEVENRLMFNINGQQKNYHYLEFENTSKTYLTSPGFVKFNIKQQEHTNFSFYVWTSAIAIGAIGIFILLKKNSRKV